MFLYQPLLILHITAASITLGVLFVQSMAVVIAMRLNGEGQRTGVRMLQERLHRGVYYPMLGIALLTGLIVALQAGAFSAGKWLHWKLVVVLLFMGLGLLVGQYLRAPRVSRPIALLVHILTFVCALVIVYLAALKPL